MMVCEYISSQKTIFSGNGVNRELLEWAAVLLLNGDIFGSTNLVLKSQVEQYRKLRVLSGNVLLDKVTIRQPSKFAKIPAKNHRWISLYMNHLFSSERNNNGRRVLLKKFI